MAANACVVQSRKPAGDDFGGRFQRVQSGRLDFSGLPYRPALRSFGPCSPLDSIIARNTLNYTNGLVRHQGNKGFCTGPGLTNLAKKLRRMRLLESWSRPCGSNRKARAQRSCAGRQWRRDSRRRIV